MALFSFLWCLSLVLKCVFFSLALGEGYDGFDTFHSSLACRRLVGLGEPRKWVCFLLIDALHWILWILYQYRNSLHLGVVSHRSLSPYTDKMYPQHRQRPCIWDCGTVGLWMSAFQVHRIVSSNSHTAQTYDSSVDISLKATRLKLGMYQGTI